MKNNYIMWVGMMIPCIIILTLSYLKLYKEKEIAAGEILLEIKTSKKQKLIKIFLDAIVIAFVLFIVPQIRKMSTSANVWSGTFVILTALIAIIVSIVTSKPQKICENGILIRFGLIKWSDIKKVKSAEAAEDEILIILRKSFRNNNQIRLSCLPDDIDTIVKVIEEKMTG